MTLYILTRHSRPPAGSGRWSYAALVVLPRPIPSINPSVVGDISVASCQTRMQRERQRERNRRKRGGKWREVKNCLYHCQCSARGSLVELEAGDLIEW